MNKKADKMNKDAELNVYNSIKVALKRDQQMISAASAQ